MSTPSHSFQSLTIEYIYQNIISLFRVSYILFLATWFPKMLVVCMNLLVFRTVLSYVIYYGRKGRFQMIKIKKYFDNWFFKISTTVYTRESIC